MQIFTKIKNWPRVVFGNLGVRNKILSDRKIIVSSDQALEFLALHNPACRKPCKYQPTESEYLLIKHIMLSAYSYTFV